MLKIIIVWILAALFTLNSLVTTLRANYTAGTLVMWLFSLALVLYGVFHRTVDAFMQSGFGLVLKVLMSVGLAAFGLMFLFVAISGYAGGAKGDEKAIVVLGAGLRGEKVGDVLRRRLVAAIEAYERNPEALIVVTGGQGPREHIPEGVAMARWLMERGVPESSILVDDESTSTEENLLYAKMLLEERGVSPDAPIAVVSNAFHCYRAGRYAAMLGFTSARTIPASMNLMALLPSYFREVLAVLYMWVFRRQF